jgi:asparagine synthase (glutamine-hydrolysing)
VPGPATCFAGVSYLQPGQFIRIRPGSHVAASQIRTAYFWQSQFPSRGQEDRTTDQKTLVDEVERLLFAAVERRLRADVPVVSYLSGGIDSSLVMAMATKIRGTPTPAFTIKIQNPRLDETAKATEFSRQLGVKPFVVPVGRQQVLDTYVELIRAAEAPVIDTSCAALLLLAKAVHGQGYKVALTGEGADEIFAGYVWFKARRLVALLDAMPGLSLGSGLRRTLHRYWGATSTTFRHLERFEQSIDDYPAFQELYSLLAISRERFYSKEMLESLEGYTPYLELESEPTRLMRWHPLHRGQYWGTRIHLAGHQMNMKGDRVAMNSSVEIRYPFLDEELNDFLANLHPRWKLRGFRDKYLLRLVGERYLPREVAWRRKAMFQAPRNSFFEPGIPPYIDQLLSEDAIRRCNPRDRLL